MRIVLIALVLTFSCFLPSLAQAQVSINVSKLTCEQFVDAKALPPRSKFAAWFPLATASS